MRFLHAQNHIELQDYHLWGPTTFNPFSEPGSILITDRSPYWFGLKRLSMALWWPSGLGEHIDMSAVICWLTMYSPWMCASITNTERHTEWTSRTLRWMWGCAGRACFDRSGCSLAPDTHPERKTTPRSVSWVKMQEELGKSNLWDLLSVCVGPKWHMQNILRLRKDKRVSVQCLNTFKTTWFSVLLQDYTKKLGERILHNWYWETLPLPEMLM